MYPRADRTDKQKQNSRRLVTAIAIVILLWLLALVASALLRTPWLLVFFAILNAVFLVLKKLHDLDNEDSGSSQR